MRPTPTSSDRFQAVSGKPEEIKETATRAGQECLASLGDAAFGVASPVLDHPAAKTAQRGSGSSCPKISFQALSGRNCPGDVVIPASDTSSH